MFASLSARLGGVLQKVRGQGRISEENIRETLREVRMALLEADVALPVVKDFVEQVRVQALSAVFARASERVVQALLYVESSAAGGRD